MLTYKSNIIIMCETTWQVEVAVSMAITTVLFSLACEAGTYRTAMNNVLNDSTCTQCPTNTVIDVQGAASCDCLEGFFRNDDGSEGIDSRCTGRLKLDRVFPCMQLVILYVAVPGRKRTLFCCVI